LTPQIPTIVTSICTTLVNNTNLIIQAALSLLDGIIKAIPLLMKQLLPQIPTIVVQICSALISCIPTLLSSAVEMFMALVTGLGEVAKKLLGELPGIVSGVVRGLTDPLRQKFSELWSGVKSIFSVVPNWFKEKFSQAWTNIKNVFGKFGEFFSGLWNTISSTFSALGTKIGDAISGAVKAGINGVISAIENIINGGIKLINGAIKLINKIPGVSISQMNLLDLPRLAKGGIVDQPTLAEVGEQGREAIIPLENNKGWIKELAAELSNTMLTPIAEMARESAPTYNSYTELVTAFKDALSEMEVIMDDEQMGKFVEKTVADAIFVA
jgi:phage-related protein